MGLGFAPIPFSLELVYSWSPLLNFCVNWLEVARKAAFTNIILNVWISLSNPACSWLVNSSYDKDYLFFGGGQNPSKLCCFYKETEVVTGANPGSYQLPKALLYVYLETFCGVVINAGGVL